MHCVDFAEPSRWREDGVLPPVAGQLLYVLSVRDLASGYQLCWLPVPAARAAVTKAVLALLFAEHSAPYAPAVTAHQLARCLRVSGEQVAKCVLQRGPSHYFVAVLPATCQIDTN
jgi:hypothetical protein